MKAFIQYLFEGLGVFVLFTAICGALTPYIYFIFGVFPWLIFIIPFVIWFVDTYINWKEDYYNRREIKKENNYEDDGEYY